MALQEVKLPDIGEGVTEGELVKWLVKVGDTVAADQPIVELMTDKATVEVPTPYPGVVKELKAKEGDVVPIESTLLVLDSQVSGGSKKVEEKPQASAPQSAATRPAQASVAAPASYSTSAIYPPVADEKVLATPATRRLAREMQVDLNQLNGSGLAGRVTREDVMSAKGAVAAGPPTMAKMPMKTPPAIPVASSGQVEERVPLRGVRKKIAENLQMAKHVIPHFTLMEEAFVDELVRTRTQAKETGEKYGVKITYLPFVMKALIATMREFPMFNASIDDAVQDIVYKKYFNIGFAADTPNGLLVPVIKNADQKNILQLSAEIQELAKKARDGKLALDEMKGATITITNIGSVGGTYATPIINHPEVAILGMYKIQDKPVWEGGEWKPKKVMNYTITCDHRLIDGAVAANFMSAFVQRVQNPSQLMLEMI